VNQHRDTLASHIGHYDMMSYFAVAENEAIGRVKYNMLEVCSKTATGNCC
jgi:splicing factor 3B subunit 5